MNLLMYHVMRICGNGSQYDGGMGWPTLYDHRFRPIISSAEDNASGVITVTGSNYLRPNMSEGKLFMNTRIDAILPIAAWANTEITTDDLGPSQEGNTLYVYNSWGNRLTKTVTVAE